MRGQHACDPRASLNFATARWPVALGRDVARIIVSFAGITLQQLMVTERADPNPWACGILAMPGKKKSPCLAGELKLRISALRTTRWTAQAGIWSAYTMYGICGCGRLTIRAANRILRKLLREWLSLHFVLKPDYFTRPTAACQEVQHVQQQMCFGSPDPASRTRIAPSEPMHLCSTLP